MRRSYTPRPEVAGARPRRAAHPRHPAGFDARNTHPASDSPATCSREMLASLSERVAYAPEGRVRAAVGVRGGRAEIRRAV